MDNSYALVGRRVFGKPGAIVAKEICGNATRAENGGSFLVRCFAYGMYGMYIDFESQDGEYNMHLMDDTVLNHTAIYKYYMLHYSRRGRSGVKKCAEDLGISEQDIYATLEYMNVVRM
jgi:hypothetical protein